ncbi:MAG: VOC family protein [Cellvibrionaceae bacterium]
MKMNYFVFGTNNKEDSIRFYDSLFEGSGLKKISSKDRITFWVKDDFIFAVAEPFDGKPATDGNGTMVGFSLGSPDEVKRVYEKALELGGLDEGKPKARNGRFSAYVRDLDKNKICLFE